MVKIGLLSDTHGFVDPKVFKHFKDVDEIWHAGDVGSIEVIEQLRAFKPLRGVYGNIDDHKIRLELKEDEIFTIDGVKVVITHIAGKPGKYSAHAHELIVEHKPKLFICGHSHILLVKNDPYFNLLWMNPGAAGFKGFHQVKTLLRFEIVQGRIQNLEVIEIGKRV